MLGSWLQETDRKLYHWLPLTRRHCSHLTTLGTVSLVVDRCWHRSTPNTAPVLLSWSPLSSLGSRLTLAFNTRRNLVTLRLCFTGVLWLLWPLLSLTWSTELSDPIPSSSLSWSSSFQNDVSRYDMLPGSHTDRDWWPLMVPRHRSPWHTPSLVTISSTPLCQNSLLISFITFSLINTEHLKRCYLSTKLNPTQK